MNIANGILYLLFLYHAYEDNLGFVLLIALTVLAIHLLSFRGIVPDGDEFESIYGREP